MDARHKEFEVNNINDPPVISDIGPQVLDEDGSLTYRIAELMEFVHDPDHPDSLLLFMPYPGENGTVELVDDTLIVFSVPENWNGFDTNYKNIYTVFKTACGPVNQGWVGSLAKRNP